MAWEGSPEWRELFERCGESHPHITVRGEVLQNIPHVAGTPLTVASILERLYVHGSVAAVVDYYADVTETQVLDAIAYAAVFVEAVCDKINGI